eukprot:7593752-Ditylum_brightwellii.AAC.1
MQRRISPTPTEQTPGHLFSTINLPATNAQQAAQAGLVFASQQASIATVSLSAVLAAPNYRSQSYQGTVSTPPGPVEPCILLTTFSMVDVVTSGPLKATRVSHSNAVSGD